MRASRVPLGELEPLLKVLANFNRLRLLEELQTPKRYAELDLQPSRDDQWGSDARPISRQAVRGHLEALMDIGVVNEIREPGGPPAYVVNHSRLFALVEQLRQIATVRPSLEAGGETIDLPHRSSPSGPTGPHLLLARGVEEGRGFPLAATRGEGGWTIGRRRGVAVCLDYDPFVSSEHARVVAKDGRFVLTDIPGNRNGTWLNYRRLARGAAAPLSPGDVIGAGKSLLVFRDAGR